MQSLPVLRGLAATGKAANVARHDRQLGGEAALMFILGRGPGAEQRQGREREEAARRGCYCSLTFCSTGPALIMVHSTMDPS